MVNIFEAPHKCFFTETCSRLSIVYCLFGLLTVLLGKKSINFGIVVIVLILLGFAFDKGLTLVESIVYLGVGAALGAELYMLLGTPVLMAESKLKHKHSMVLFFAQLVALLLAFPFVDATIPETGFIYGVWLSMLGFLQWWAFVMFINLKKAKISTLEDDRLMRTYNLILLDGVLLFLPALVSPFSPVIFTSIGVGAALVGNVILNHLLQE